MLATLFVLLFALVSAPQVQPEAADNPYTPPLDRPVERPFDVSNGPYGRGNRGLDYAVRPGDVAAAIGDGTVVFAGSVAGKKWVTVLHPDGSRSSSGPMATIEVSAGDRVARGQRIGTTGSAFHLGVRRGSAYIDPATLFRAKRRHARLVPVPRAPRSRLNPLRGSRRNASLAEDFDNGGWGPLHFMSGVARSARPSGRPMVPDVHQFPVTHPGR